MRRFLFVLGAWSFFLLCMDCQLGLAMAAHQWKDLTHGLRDTDFEIVASDPQESEVLYLCSSRAVYKSVDKGKTWKEVFSRRGSWAINYLSVDPASTDTVYVATQDGLYCSLDRGSNWKRIFTPVADRERDCLCVEATSEGIYVGTSSGLFSSYDGGSNWQPASGFRRNTKVVAIAACQQKEDLLYAATSEGAFKTEDGGKSWEKIYPASPEEIEEEDLEEDSDTDELEEFSSELKFIAIDQAQPEDVYLATEEGILFSEDAGESWQGFPAQGLLSSELDYLLVSTLDSSLYAAGEGGVFRYPLDGRIWQKLYRGMTSTRARFLTLDNSGFLWAATEGGIFKTERPLNQPMLNDWWQDLQQAKEILEYFSDEPTVQEIQEAAVRYAEVQSEKIESWRRGAALRGLFPVFRIDYDKSVSRYSGELWSVGPRDWGYYLQWDVGDLIWNPYQKDIDVRSRLMVQLRDDILDEVTRYYFERRRLQTELYLSPPEDLKEKIEIELRLEELTANIDALTGGYLSRYLSNTN